MIQASVYTSEDKQIHVALFHRNTEDEVRYISLKKIELRNRETSSRDSRCDDGLNLNSTSSDWLSMQRLQEGAWAVWDVALPADLYLMNHCKAEFTIEVDTIEPAGSPSRNVVVIADLLPGEYDPLPRGVFGVGPFALVRSRAIAHSAEVLSTEGAYRVEFLLPGSSEEAVWNVDDVNLKCGAGDVQQLQLVEKLRGVVLARRQWGALVLEPRGQFTSAGCEWKATLSKRQGVGQRRMVLQWKTSDGNAFSRFPTMY